MTTADSLPSISSIVPIASPGTVFNTTDFKVDAPCCNCSIVLNSKPDANSRDSEFFLIVSLMRSSKASFSSSVKLADPLKVPNFSVMVH